MSDKVRPFGQPLGIVFELVAQRQMRAGRTETDAEDEIAAQEERSLTEDDLLNLLDRTSASEDEDLPSIDLNLWHVGGI